MDEHTPQFDLEKRAGCALIPGTGLVAALSAGSRRLLHVDWTLSHNLIKIGLETLGLGKILVTF